MFFKRTIQFLKQINAKNVQLGSNWNRDLYSWPIDDESLHLTTRPGLLPQSLCFTYFYFPVLMLPLYLFYSKWHNSSRTHTMQVVGQACLHLRTNYCFFALLCKFICCPVFTLLSFFLLYYLHNILSMYFFSLSLSYFLWELCNESETFFAVTKRNHFQVKCEKSVDSIFSSSHRLNKSFPYLHTFLSKTTFTHSPSKLLLSHCSSLSPFLSCKLSMYPFLSFFHLRNLPIIL